MKNLYNINKFALIITLVLYLTIYLGMYAQIVLGALQVISSILLLFYWERIPNNLQKKTYLYWFTITVYGLCWLLKWNIHGTFQAVLIITGLFVLPMLIAIFFLLLLGRIKSQLLHATQIQKQ